MDASFTHEEDFFKNENQAAPALLSDNGKLHTTKKMQQTWNVCEDVTETFKKLSNCPQKV